MSPFQIFGRSSILPAPTTPLDEHLELGEPLGRGHFGVVRACVDKSSGERLACKSIDKSKLRCWEEEEDVQREVSIMRLLGNHSNVVTLRGAYEDDTHVHLAMDCCEGGELFDEISLRGPMSEERAAQVLQGVARALAHCHSLGVLHRDLKPENILLVHRRDDQRRLEAKLADFGLSMRLKDGETMRGLAGSPYYLAPEVLTGSYDHKADVWSMGVVLYMMLSETAPFYGDMEADILESIRKAEFEFSSSIWEEVSEGAKDLVRLMLQKDPAQRPTARAVLQHPWLILNASDGSDAAAQPLHIPRSCSEQPAVSTCTPEKAQEGGSKLGVLQQCQSLNRENSPPSQLLTWLSPQLAAAANGQCKEAALEGSPLLETFNEAFSELEDGVHYFVLEEEQASLKKPASEGAEVERKALCMRLVGSEMENMSLTCSVEDVPKYEPTASDALDWIFGL